MSCPERNLKLRKLQSISKSNYPMVSDAELSKENVTGIVKWSLVNFCRTISVKNM